MSQREDWWRRIREGALGGEGNPVPAARRRLLAGLALAGGAVMLTLLVLPWLLSLGGRLP